MSNLENIIRPFQTVDVTPPRRYVASGAPAAPPVLVQIGRTGKGRAFNGSDSLTVTHYCGKAIVEQLQQQNL
jgi:hypothetical protein